MKSASESPVLWPLNVNAPLVGRLFSVSIREWIQLPPTENWWCAADEVEVVRDLPADRVEIARVGRAARRR